MLRSRGCTRARCMYVVYDVRERPCLVKLAELHVGFTGPCKYGFCYGLQYRGSQRLGSQRFRSRVSLPQIYCILYTSLCGTRPPHRPCGTTPSGSALKGARQLSLSSTGAQGASGCHSSIRSSAAPHTSVTILACAWKVKPPLEVVLSHIVIMRTRRRLLVLIP
jgi:hypothetical protein